jgi:hypothetical protein
MTINKRPARHEIEELLPPYAPETLKRRHAEQVEQVLRNQPSADLWLRRWVRCIDEARE